MHERRSHAITTPNSDPPPTTPQPLPRASNVVHDQSVSADVFVPTVRPHASDVNDVVIADPAAGVGPVDDFTIPACFVPAGIPHTAGAFSRSP